MFNKSNELIQLDIYPKIVPVGKEITFTLRAMDPAILIADEIMIDIWEPNSGDDQVADYPDVAKTPLAPPMHGYTFAFTPKTEQEYFVYLTKVKDGRKTRTPLSIYALEADLLARTPLVGEFHAHTVGSDGTQGGAFMAARYRQHGFDVLTITDHRRMAPSLAAVEAFRELDMPYRIYHGEEVHPHKTRTHMVNFMGDSVNAYALAESAPSLWRNHDPSPAWSAEMEALMATFTDLPEGVVPWELASVMITARRIRESGGLAILAHPHWIWKARSVPDPLTRYLFEHDIVDALELVGGQCWQENQLQMAFYDHLRLSGLDMPIVGASDAHNTLSPAHRKTDHFDEKKTILLATENTKEGIMEAIMSKNTVAVLQEEGENPQIRGGSYRIQQYVMFLLVHYFPLRDELYFEEGRLLHEYVAGTPGTAEKLQATFADHTAFEKKYICR